MISRKSAPDANDVRVIIDLPWPPTANRYWRNVNGPAIVGVGTWTSSSSSKSLPNRLALRIDTRTGPWSRSCPCTRRDDPVSAC